MKRFVLAIALALPIAAQDAPAPPKPGPYVGVYHDEHVSFQIRRDKIRRISEGTYYVWLRWLFAEGKPWKSDLETVRLLIAELDCTRIRVRELAVIHKNAAGKVYDVEELDYDQAPWKSFEAKSGATSALAQVCEFIPQLLDAAH